MIAKPSHDLGSVGGTWPLAAGSWPLCVVLGAAAAANRGKRMLKRYAVLGSLAVAIVALAQAAAASTPAVSVTRNVTYESVGRVALKLDVYRPAEDGRRPAVVLLHGGGWSDGDKVAFADIATALAASGFVAVPVDYRLACTRKRSQPLCGYRFPAALSDAERAVRWLRRHARHYGVSSGHIGVFGASAGANLALMLAMTARGTERVQTVVSWSGPPDLRFPIGGQTTRAQITPVISYLGCDPSTSGACLQRAATASPVTHVTRSAPPTYLFNSDDEVTPLKGAREMRNLLHHLHVPVRLTVFSGKRH
ncbi:MAG: alpha/beta hydrolase fold domain-containing protein, partial [Solirubrobacteraceae bacterium]